MSDASSPPDPPAAPPTPPPPHAHVPAVVPGQQALHPGPVTGPYHPNDEERTLGMLIHLLALLTSFIGPLVLWLVKRESSRFVDHNGKECINFIISFTVYEIVLVVVGAVATLASGGVALFGLVPLLFVLMILVYVFEILSCIKAYRGEWIRYPLTFRLIR